MHYYTSDNPVLWGTTINSLAVWAFTVTMFALQIICIMLH